MSWISLQVTVGTGGGPTQFGPVHPHVPIRQILIQNNAAHSMRIGDSTVSATVGMYLASGPGGGDFNSGPVDIYNSRLSDFYVFGTAGDIVDIFYNS
jgi:hypothetical protein